MTVFERIQKLSKNRGKSVKDVARELSFGESTIYKWKTQSPKGKDLEKIADYFDVSIDYLMGRTDNPFIESNDQYSDLVMNFRKNEKEIPEEQRPLYRAQVNNLMDHIRETMKEYDAYNIERKKKDD